MSGSTVEIEISRGHSGDSLQDDYSGGKYYTSNDGTKVTLERPHNPSLFGYESATHILPRKYTIKSIKHKGQQQEGLEALKNCTYVTVYFSELDQDYSKPLLIQFDGKGDYYYAGSPNYWAKDENPNSIGLLKALDKQNCGQRSAHVMNICRKDESKYPCPSCNNKDITMESSDISSSYKRVTHKLSGMDKIETIRNDIHTIIPPQGLESVTVYWYPLTDGTPLLIYFSSDSAWMKRTSKYSNRWEEIENNAPESDNDDAKILTLLKSIKKKPTGLSGGEIAGISVPTVLTGGGLIGVTIWKWPDIMSSLITRL